MFNTPKVSQSEKLIYPERLAKGEKEKEKKSPPTQASPAAGSGSLARTGAGCGAVITKITAVRITPAARKVRSDRGSARMSQPRNNATTGFTNAYVPTRAGVLFSQLTPASRKYLKQWFVKHDGKKKTEVHSSRGQKTRRATAGSH